MKNSAEPTRTADTIKQYRIRSKRILNRFMRDCFITNPRFIDTFELGTWLLEQKTNLAPSAWRQYRSAILCYAEKSKILNYDVLKEILNSRQGESAGGAIASKRQQRAKSLNERELLLIKNYFNSKIRCRESFQMTLAFFIATLATGLRPCEWKDAQLITINGNAKLVVRNAKNTNGRAHGEFRTIHIPQSEKEALHCIESTLAYIKNIEGHSTDDKLFRKNYTKRLRTMRDQFSEMNKFLFQNRKKYIHMYSGRHDAARRFKESGCTREEVAALMGHASILTAGEHYGRKGRGKGGVTPQVQPDKDDVARVGNLNANRVIKSHPNLSNEIPKNSEDMIEKPPINSPINFDGFKERIALLAEEMEEHDNPKNNGPKLF